jgi:hypothetical protein
VYILYKSRGRAATRRRVEALTLLIYINIAAVFIRVNSGDGVALVRRPRAAAELSSLVNVAVVRVLTLLRLTLFLRGRGGLRRGGAVLLNGGFSDLNVG